MSNDTGLEGSSMFTLPVNGDTMIVLLNVDGILIGSLKRCGSPGKIRQLARGTSDALYRAVLALDDADEALVLSAITEDIDAKMPDSTAHGIAEFKAAVFDRVSKLNTTHFLSNMRINITSSRTATATCPALAQHVRPGHGVDTSLAKFTSALFMLAIWSTLEICGR
ncbi:hypothetical protein FCOIX_5644 [Fusarium coicis]|nr:hypothetical protein FCOIX_5644 [Fusarium coicis]